MFAILRGGTGRRKQSVNRVLSAEKRVFRGEMCPEDTCTRCRPTTRTGRLATSHGLARRLSLTTDACNIARRCRAVETVN